ncbi:YcxB family protein [Pseudanabaena sp. PCC 6802]|uniref:YcxB family protein n=1 Tax=Pseudanabaena sp. PCC 6802 TaxID=118173 RepID=UPI000377EBF2|nr:YcxB family protein [Pseudanabaena sp. PCC 6802]
MIVLKYRLTQKDYVDAHYLNSMHSKPLKSMVGISLAIAVIVGYGYSIIASIIASGMGLDIWLSILFLGVTLWVVIDTFFLIPLRARRDFSRRKHPQDEDEATLYPEIIELVSRYGTSRIPISDFDKYRIGETMVLLYLPNRVFLIFPRRSFPSEEDFQTFLSYLRSNLGKPK